MLTLLDVWMLSSLSYVAYFKGPGQEKSSIFNGPRSSAFAARHHRQIAVLDLYCAHIQTSSLFHYLSHTAVRSWNNNGLIPFFLSRYKCFSQNSRNISKKQQQTTASVSNAASAANAAAATKAITKLSSKK